MKNPVIQAHRGASAYAPENTLPAFKLALEMGADGIECDIHLTKDGKFLVCHDETVDRTSTSRGLISELTLKQIKTFDFGVKFDQSFAGVKAPTLEEMLDTVKKMSVINIEIKPFAHGMGQENALRLFYSILREFDVIPKVIVSSFDYNLLELLKKLFPEMYTCWLYIEMKQAARKAEKIGCNAIHPYYGLLKKQTLLSAHRRNMKVNSWTVDKDKEILQMMQMGCDGIITDCPNVAIKVRNELFCKSIAEI